MARVTIEDCLLVVKNRFELVAVAAKKARALSEFGSESSSKNTVQALKEIAEGNLGPNMTNMDDLEE